MSHANAPAGTVQQEQGVRTLPLGWLMFLLSTLLVPGYFAVQTASLVLTRMEEKGWAKALHTDTFLIDCLLSSACGAAFQTGFLNLFPLLSLAVPAAGLVVYAFKATPKRYTTKDPGLSWWAQAEDTGLDQYRTHDPRRPNNKLLGYIGHLLSVNRDGKIEYAKSIPLYVRMSALAENVLVLGGVGAGKTRGYFRPLIMLAAHLGFTVIVFDLKYPQPDSGFFDMIGYWVKRKRKVMMFTPFSPNTMRLPLLDSVEDYASALSMATTIMPPPEYGLEPGKHYRDRDRGVLAAFLLYLARSDAPNFSELLKMAQWTPNELKKWFEDQAKLDEKSDVVLNLKGIFAQGNQEVASVLQGIKNALRIFYNPLVARATESLDGENIDIRSAFREPTLLYIGIQQEYMMEGDGVVLLQLTKRYIDRELQREAEAQGGAMKRHVAYVLDEFPSFGQLPYMMRSLGVLRSYNVSHHIGVQNLAQLAVVYGDNYSKALTTNVIGRKVFFPLAVDDEEREVFSQHLGMTTVYEFSETDSRKRFLGTDLNESTRQGTNLRKVARPLLAPEEFPHFRPMEAVVKVRGANPIRVFMPAIEDRFLDGPDIPRGLPNRLNELYRQVNPNGENMARFTQEVILSGVLGTASLPDGEPYERLAEQFREWVEAVLASGARLRYSSGNLDRLYVRLSDLPDALRVEQTLRGNAARNWTSLPTSDELRLRDEGLALLSREVRTQLDQRAIFGALDLWLEKNGPLIENHPEREAIAEDGRGEVQAILEEQRVLLSIGSCQNLYGVAPKRLSKRVGTRRLIVIDRTDPADFWQALQDARRQEEPDEAAEPAHEEATARPAPTSQPKGKPKRSVSDTGSAWTNAEEEARLQGEQLTTFAEEPVILHEDPEEQNAWQHIQHGRA
ncbi:type IV secretory system conjugative DNA transfer family protein [Deinococcus aluminii]|uniref:Type IV secretory system conjugative DNA transfer family protein n=1 Tax=Deinococcus aluminii TaxID=1656885 RepID=A0ABP9XEW7_9DEIO